MKCVSIIVGALAAFATAAPAVKVEERNQFDLSRLNNLRGFNNVNVNYLFGLSGLDLNLLNILGQNNNLNVLQFSGLFQQNNFDVLALLQLQQLATVLNFGQLGLFNAFDLSNLSLNTLDLGVLGGIGGFGLNSLIDSGLSSQVATIAQTFTNVVVVKE